MRRNMKPPSSRAGAALCSRMNHAASEGAEKDARDAIEERQRNEHDHRRKGGADERAGDFAMAE
jgi:hypothetical protein